MRKFKLSSLALISACFITSSCLVSCQEVTKEYDLNIIDSDKHISVNPTKFKLNTELVIKYTVTKGYMIDDQASMITINNNVYKVSDLQHNNDSVVIEASKVDYEVITVNFISKLDPSYEWDLQIVQSANITISPKKFKVNEQLVINYTTDPGFIIDPELSTVLIEEQKHTVSEFSCTTTTVTIPSGLITSGLITAEFIAKYDPDKEFDLQIARQECMTVQPAKFKLNQKLEIYYQTENQHYLIDPDLATITVGSKVHYVKDLSFDSEKVILPATDVNDINITASFPVKLNPAYSFDIQILGQSYIDVEEAKFRGGEDLTISFEVDDEYMLDSLQSTITIGSHTYGVLTFAYTTSTILVPASYINRDSIIVSLKAEIDPDWEYDLVVETHYGISVRTNKFVLNQNLFIEYETIDEYAIDEALSTVTIGQETYTVSDFEYDRECVYIPGGLVNSKEISLNFYAKVDPDWEYDLEIDGDIDITIYTTKFKLNQDLVVEYGIENDEYIIDPDSSNFEIDSSNNDTVYVSELEYDDHSVTLPAALVTSKNISVHFWTKQNPDHDWELMVETDGHIYADNVGYRFYEDIVVGYRITTEGKIIDPNESYFDLEGYKMYLTYVQYDDFEIKLPGDCVTCGNISLYLISKDDPEHEFDLTIYADEHIVVYTEKFKVHQDLIIEYEGLDAYILDENTSYLEVGDNNYYVKDLEHTDTYVKLPSDYVDSSEIYVYFFNIPGPEFEYDLEIIEDFHINVNTDTFKLHQELIVEFDLDDDFAVNWGESRVYVGDGDKRITYNVNDLPHDSNSFTLSADKVNDTHIVVELKSIYSPPEANSELNTINKER